MLLSLARRLADDPAARRLALVFTAGEEIGLVGAMRFAQSARQATSESGGRLPMVINVDSVGAGDGIWIAGSDGSLIEAIRIQAGAIGLPATFPCSHGPRNISVRCLRILR